VTAKKQKLLLEMFPALSAELQQLLAEQGEAGLAAQVPELSVIERCRCGDDFCGTFYVLPKPAGAYGPSHRNVALTPKEGMLILDVVSGKIAAVEVLYRNEIRQKLQIEFP
jgi:hypothetical protein